MRVCCSMGKECEACCTCFQMGWGQGAAYAMGRAAASAAASGASSSGGARGLAKWQKEYDEKVGALIVAVVVGKQCTLLGSPLWARAHTLARGQHMAVTSNALTSRIVGEQ